MNLAITVILGLLFIGAAAAVIRLAYLGIKKLKEIVRKRREKREATKVAFGNTRKIANKNAKEILEKAPSVSMEDLEEISKEDSYFVADYDERTGEVTDYAVIWADEVDPKLDELLEDTNGGVVLFE